MIRIKSKKAGFRRCGIAHPAEFVEYPNSRFSGGELKILKAEPMLVVEVNPANPVGADKSGKEQAKDDKKGKG
jgi:hypothetical protein